MTDLTLANLTAQLANQSKLLTAAQEELSACELRAAECRSRADLAEAKAFVVAEGSVEERKRRALIEAEELLLDAEIADAGLRVARSNLKTISTRIDVGRTLISSARAEMQNFGGATT